MSPCVDERAICWAAQVESIVTGVPYEIALKQEINHSSVSGDVRQLCRHNSFAVCFVEHMLVYDVMPYFLSKVDVAVSDADFETRAQTMDIYDAVIVDPWTCAGKGTIYFCTEQAVGIFQARGEKRNAEATRAANVVIHA